MDASPERKVSFREDPPVGLHFNLVAASDFSPDEIPFFIELLGLRMRLAYTS